MTWIFSVFFLQYGANLWLYLNTYLKNWQVVSNRPYSGRKNDEEALGAFQPPKRTDQYQLLNCFKVNGNTITHTTPESKNEIMAEWIVDPLNFEGGFLYGVVVYNYTTVQKLAFDLWNYTSKMTVKLDRVLYIYFVPLSAFSRLIVIWEFSSAIPHFVLESFLIFALTLLFLLFSLWFRHLRLRFP